MTNHASIAELGLYVEGSTGPATPFIGNKGERTIATNVRSQNTSAGAEDRRRLERMIGNAGRPAFAHNRLLLLPNGKVSYRLRRPYYIGQTEVVLAPVAFLSRLAMLIPPPRKKRVATAPRARLLARVFAADVLTCPHCSGERTIRAWVTERSSIARILGYWELNADVPAYVPARAPPQTELFDGADLS